MCSKAFPSVSSLLVHERLHVADCPEIPSDLCDAVYGTKAALQIHVVGKHGEGFTCQHCAARFDTPVQRLRHQCNCK